MGDSKAASKYFLHHLARGAWWGPGEWCRTTTGMCTHHQSLYRALTRSLNPTQQAKTNAEDHFMHDLPLFNELPRIRKLSFFIHALCGKRKLSIRGCDQCR
jgi:hypothetical protein